MAIKEGGYFYFNFYYFFAERFAVHNLWSVFLYQKNYLLTLNHYDD